MVKPWRTPDEGEGRPSGLSQWSGQGSLLLYHSYIHFFHHPLHHYCHFVLTLSPLPASITSPLPCRPFPLPSSPSLPSSQPSLPPRQTTTITPTTASLTPTPPPALPLPPPALLIAPLRPRQANAETLGGNYRLITVWQRYSSLVSNAGGRRGRGD